MPSKDALRKEFYKDYQKHYGLEFFKKQGFERRVCPKCGKGYWSLGRGDCGDSSHTDYSFMKENPRKETYPEFWNRYADFWKKRGHEVISRYPVLPRWREDLFFVNASIVDFQRLEDGVVHFEYPHNPLIVPQVCLRFVDIANVGVTGRHFSCFTMAGQHAFNPPREGYWKEECIDYNFEFLTQVLGVKKEELVYGEDFWAMPDFSALGPCIESFARGAELVNSVFMQFRAKGDEGIEELPTKVIDVGWGFERLLWFSNGSLTAYDSAFPREIEFMKESSHFHFDKELIDKYARLSASLDIDAVHNLREEKEKVAKALGITLKDLENTVAPMQAIYAIGDHSRSLLFALTDGMLPSNAKGGYNLRVLARRALSFIQQYKFDFSLYDLMVMHSQSLKPMFPELSENLDSIQDIISVEEEKFSNSLEKGRKIAGETIFRGETVSVDKLLQLYESHGITPELLEKVGEDLGKKPEIPPEFYKRLSERHAIEEKKEAVKAVEGIPKTKLSYYSRQDERDFTATVIAVDEKRNAIALDETLFYPEGGGQTADHGELNGVKVNDVQEELGVVWHFLDGSNSVKSFSKGSKVNGKIDDSRRDAITKHHSATHLMIATCRSVLGKHVWQAGSKKEEEEAHVDVTHYKKLSQEEEKTIECEVNERIFEAHPITAKEWDRGEAEKNYGFRLYQGGGAIGKRIRVVEVQGVDVEACGGLHRRNTSEIGFVRITHSEQVQDGVVRVHYKAGVKALEYSREESELIQSVCGELSVNKDTLSKGVQRIFSEWKERGKQVDEMQEELAEEKANNLVQGKNKNQDSVIESEVPYYDSKFVEKLALKISGKGFPAIVSGKDGFIAVSVPKGSQEDARKLLERKGAKGGGTKEFARGKRN